MNKLLKTPDPPIEYLSSTINTSAEYAVDYLKGLNAYDSGDYTAAFKEWRVLAELGHAVAQRKLGAMYESGRGIVQDFKEAAKWFRKCAEQGDGEAQASLGLMYYQGRGALQDTTAAHMWFNIAVANGNEKAREHRDMTGRKLSQSEIVKTEQMAKRCMASSYKDCD